MHRTPADLPSGIPGKGDEIAGAMQHAPHPLRHEIFFIHILAWEKGGRATFHLASIASITKCN
jgi:hypothetical protein